MPYRLGQYMILSEEDVINIQSGHEVEATIKDGSKLVLILERQFEERYRKRQNQITQKD